MPAITSDDLIPAALAAGRAILELYEAGFEVEDKEDRSPVTEADRRGEAIILEHLAQLAPDVPVVAEEAVSAGQVPDVGDRFFLVDPLDGTKEFIQRRGDFTVNIALIEAGRPVVGVVSAPARCELYCGDVADGGARLMEIAGGDIANSQTIEVRRPSEAGFVAVASRSHRTPETDAYLARYNLADSVSVGSSLKFCLIARGEADLYPRLGPTMEWDTAAAHAVLLAAGGRVIAPDGSPLTYGKPEFRNSFFVASGDFEPLPLA